MAEKKPFRVLIIGGGPAGMLTAQTLQMQGANVTVYEQDGALDARPRNWSYGIYWAQTPLSECLPESLQKEVLNTQVNDHYAGPDDVFNMYNAKTEELLKAVPIPYHIRLNRRRFLRLIQSGLDVQYGKRIKEVSSDGTQATAIFEDGTSATGDLLIGAEGAHSVVRDYLLGHSKASLKDTPFIVTSTIAKLSPEAVKLFFEFSDRLCCCFHPDGMFYFLGIHDANDGKQPGEWEFMIHLTWIDRDPKYNAKALTSEEIARDLQERLKDFGPRLRAIAQSIPEGTRHYHNRLCDWLPEQWDNRNGTITLVGDAAHSMTFHRGQGLNNAVHDAADLSRSVKEHGFTAQAIDEYEKVMIPRGRQAVELSMENSLATHDWDKLLNSPLFKMGIKAKRDEA